MSAISDKQISAKGNSTEHSRECISMLANQNDELKQENLTLKRDNDYLKERLNVISFAMSDLKKQLETTESKKQSVVTIIRILQPEQADLHVTSNSHASHEPRDDSVILDKSVLLESQIDF